MFRKKDYILKKNYYKKSNNITYVIKPGRSNTSVPEQLSNNSTANKLKQELEKNDNDKYLQKYKRSNV